MGKKVDQNRVGGVLEPITEYAEHLRLIGEVVTRASALEGRLALLFWELIGSPDNASTIYYAMGTGMARLTVLRAMVEEVLEGYIKADALAAIERARRAAERRNDIVHAQWGIPTKGGPDPFYHLERPATTNKVVSRICTLANLREIVEAIRVADLHVGQVTLTLQERDPQFRAAMDEARRRAAAAGDPSAPV